MTPAGASDRLTRWLVDRLPEVLPAWLPEQRWYGGKARTVSRILVDDVVWLPAERHQYAVIVLTMAYAGSSSDDAGTERYALLAGAVDNAERHPVIERLGEPSASVLIEAVADRAAVHALLRGLAAGGAITGVCGGHLVFADATPDAAAAFGAGLDASPAIEPVGQEQSNSSVRVGRTHVFKLFRRLEIGTHPQIEVGRHLAHVGFRETSPLEGSVTYVSANGAEMALGSVERWVENDGDGWRYVVSRLGSTAGPVDETLIHDLDCLGTTTAAFHAALATSTSIEAFKPEPASADDVAAWREAILGQTRRTMRLIEENASGWPDSAARLAAPLARAGDAVAHRVEAMSSRVELGFEKIRIHGDYHLGQTLRTPGGFAVIDFEGEPTRPLEERRMKHHALRDVAGMLRSIDYAVAAAGIDRPDQPAGLVHAFLAGYRRAAAPGGASVRFLPSNPLAFDEWVALFEIGKVLYEIEYEANNRPTWLHLPLAALTRLLAEPTQG